MDKWDSRFLGMAMYVAEWSKDPSTKVGAVITDAKNRVISLGFNGFPRSVEDKIVTREHKLRATIHAETNALLFAKEDVEGMTCYVSHPPCAQCAAKLIQAGIQRVVWHSPDPEFVSRWAEDMAIAKQMYDEAGVEYAEL